MVFNQIPEINPLELAEKLKSNANFYIIDVREDWELQAASLKDPRVHSIPMSRMSRELKAAFPEALSDPDAEIITLCHHGVRSVNVARWMLQQGWKNVTSAAGGIDAYAQQVDSTVGLY